MKRSLLLSSLLASTAALLAPHFAAAQDGVDGEAASDTEVITVRGRFIPEPQRETSQVATFLTSEDLARAGDADAAVALTRLSGISVVGSRFAYVRGLGERYSLALLNGSPLPSPEPLLRTVPLDLFPSSVLDGIDVQKTYSANYPGDFGGGVIDMRSLLSPTEPYLSVSIGTSYNTETTTRGGIYVRGSDTDWSGYDDGLRDLPSGLAAALASGQRLSDFSDAEVEAFGESLVNSPLSVIQDGEIGPNFNASAEGGALFNFDNFELGLIGVAGYDQSWTTERATRQQQDNGIVGIGYDTLETTLNASFNALGTASVSWGDQYVQSTLLYLHSTDKEAQIDNGFDFNSPGTGNVLDESSSWIERELAMLQFSGEHFFGAFDLNWRGAVARSTRDSPYERSLRRIINADGVPAYTQANNYNIRFTELTDDIVSGGADLSYTFTFAGDREATLTGGFDYSNTEREYLLNSLRFAGGNSLPEDVQVARPDFLFSPDNIDPARFVLTDPTSVTDNYSGELEIASGFAQADFDVTPFIRATLGVRYEDSTETVSTFDRFGNLGPGTSIDSQYWLPSALVTWNFAEDLQLRLGYSQTIARPQFRELARSAYFDPATDRIYRGNSFLVDSEFENFDARLEYYMGRDQFLTLAAFHKEIENPIEEIQFATSTFVFETTFINSPSATLTGGEFEYRRYFESPIDAPWFNDRDWRFAVNYTYTQAEVEASAGDTIINPLSGAVQDASLFNLDGAPLQGTPENIFNVQFGYESPSDELTLLLGWVDDRILQRGSSSLPDVIEDPGIQLDLVYRHYFSFRDVDFTLGFSGRNLLDERHIEFQESDQAGRTDFDSYDRGRSFSLSLTSEF